MKVRIYQPAKNAMQSGRAKTKQWILEYETTSARRPEPLMGWTASEDTLNQVQIKFETLNEAVAFANKEGWEYTVAQPHARKVVPRNYADNFKYVPPADGK
jgi:hypothetical protein